LLSISVFLFSCIDKGVAISKPKISEQYDIAKLREMYSSGKFENWPKPTVDSIVLANGFEDIGALPKVPFPADNPFSEEKKMLGKMLFEDPRLSSSGQIACASCHDSQTGWGDGKRVAFGHNRQNGKRNAMTILNTAYYKTLFWDGRAKSLEHQATMPVQDMVEMHETLENAVTKIQKIEGYKPYFQKAFGNEEISQDKIMKAIATFERTITSASSRFDLFIKGNPTKLSNDEVLGLHLFRTKARCVNCHNTGLFSDNQFHNDGQTLFGSNNEDLGRYNVTKQKEDIGKFRTPSLREIAQTGPWMHHGNFPTLKDVIQFYNLGNPTPVDKKYKGKNIDLLPKSSSLLKKLSLTKKEENALVAFLSSITTTPRRLNPSELPK